METKDLTIIENSDIQSIEAGQRAEYDIQISTAKRYPRNLARVKENCLAIVTMDKETAASCRYVLPRGGKSLSGPSVHLARILAQQYGNIRVDAKIKQITDKQIISEAVAFDLETNYAVKVEVRRSIINRDGNRFNDDMITVTGNAANAISFRNAVLNVIPKGLSDICYNTSIRQITGDLTSDDKLIAARNKAFEYFKTMYNVTEDQILKAINCKSIGMVKEEQIADLRGIIQSLKDGETTPEEVFNIYIPEPVNPDVKAERKTQHPNHEPIAESNLKEDSLKATK